MGQGERKSNIMQSKNIISLTVNKQAAYSA